MKKLIIIISFMIAFTGCHHEDLKPEKSTLPTNEKEAPGVAANGRTMDIPQEELYITQGDYLYTVDITTGTRYALGTGWSGAVAMATVNNWIYIIKGDELWRVHPLNYTLTLLSTGWQGTVAMTSSAEYNDDLFIAKGGEIFRFNLSTLTSTSLGSWPGLEAMTFSPGIDSEFLFFIQGDNMWKMSPVTGVTVSMGTGWSGAEVMTGIGDFIYTVWGGQLWSTRITDNYTYAMGDAWGGTEAITNFGFIIYAVQGGELWKTYDFPYSFESLGNSWGGTTAMAPRNYPSW